MNSCIDSVNAKITRLSSPGTLTGSTTRTAAPIRLQPSTRAASSISRGTCLKNPDMSQVQNGMVNVGYTTTSAKRESWSPNCTITCDNGMNNSDDGIRYVRKIRMPSVVEPGKFNRASAYPAG